MKIAILRTDSETDSRPILAVGRERTFYKQDETLNFSAPPTDPLRITVDNAPEYLKGSVGLLDVAANESARGAILVYATMLDE